MAKNSDFYGLGKTRKNVNNPIPMKLSDISALSFIFYVIQ